MVELNEVELEIEYYTNGRVHYIRETPNDKTLVGIYKDWYHSGNPWEETYYKKNDMHGPYTYWYDNGHKMEEAHYVNGKLHGPSCEWHKNGVMSKRCRYNNNELHGLYISWHENGNVEQIEFFDNDCAITDDIRSVVKDISNITEHEKTLIQIKFGIDI